MELEIKKILEENSRKLDGIYHSVEQTRKYFMWTLIISVIFIVLPLLGIALILPSVMSGLTGGLLM